MKTNPKHDENENMATLDLNKCFPSVFKGAEIINVSGGTGKKFVKILKSKCGMGRRFKSNCGCSLED